MQILAGINAYEPEDYYDSKTKLTALFTKPSSTVLPAVGMTLRDRSPLTASWHFQELYQAKPGTVLPAAL